MPSPLFGFSPYQKTSCGFGSSSPNLSLSGHSHSGTTTISGFSARRRCAFLRNAMLQFQVMSFIINKSSWFVHSQSINVKSFFRLCSMRWSHKMNPNLLLKLFEDTRIFILWRPVMNILYFYSFIQSGDQVQAHLICLSIYFVSQLQLVERPKHSLVPRRLLTGWIAIVIVSCAMKV